MQVTHSNFAYNHHQTDFVETEKGFMPYPKFDVKDGKLISILICPMVNIY